MQFSAPKKHPVFALGWDFPLVHRGFREGLLRLPFIEMNRWWLPVKQGFWQPPNIISSNQAIFVNSFLSWTCWNSFRKRTSYKENIAPQFFWKDKRNKGASGNTHGATNAELHSRRKTTVNSGKEEVPIVQPWIWFLLNTWICFRCLEKVKPYSPKWWLPWRKAKITWNKSKNIGSGISQIPILTQKPLSDADTRHCNESSQLHTLQNWRGRDNQKDVELTCTENSCDFFVAEYQLTKLDHPPQKNWRMDTEKRMGSWNMYIYGFKYGVILGVSSQLPSFGKLRGNTLQGRKGCQTFGHPEVKGKTSSKMTWKAAMLVSGRVKFRDKFELLKFPGSVS